MAIRKFITVSKKENYETEVLAFKRQNLKCRAEIEI